MILLEVHRFLALADTNLQDLTRPNKKYIHGLKMRRKVYPERLSSSISLAAKSVPNLASPTGRHLWVCFPVSSSGWGVGMSCIHKAALKGRVQVTSPIKHDGSSTKKPDIRQAHSAAQREPLLKFFKKTPGPHVLGSYKRACQPGADLAPLCSAGRCQ